MLLWSEYRERCPDGFGYSWFAERYRAYARRLDVVLRGEHRAGEKLFIDFPGATLPIVDRLTGETTRAELFVAVLGASNYTYAEAIPSQALPHWVAAHVHCFEFHWRRPGDPRARQPAGGGDEGRPLRGRPQPDLRGVRRPLRLCSDPRSAGEAKGQGLCN
jgi:transposase